MTAPAPYENRSYWESLHHRHAGELSAVGYSGMGEGFNRTAYRRRLRAADRLLRRNSVRCDNLLESGVGVGAYAGLWHKLGVSHWTGTDISASAIADLQHRFPESSFVVADLTRQEWDGERLPASHYTLVTAIDVLYHLVDDDGFGRALKHLADCVVPGGHLVLSDVFCGEDRRIAAHVTRRALDSYTRILGPGFCLQDREPVFAILGDPVARPGNPLSDVALFTVWRVLAKMVRSAPGVLRNPVGAAVAWCAFPMDALLRQAGFASGRNLELALFRKQP